MPSHNPTIELSQVHGLEECQKELADNTLLCGGIKISPRV